jgi:HAD superfamily hydrolase (TIGR01549 family)
VIKAILFDWFNTLATYDPPREELYRQAFQEFNIGLPLKTIYQGLLVEDRFFFSEAGKALVRGKPPEERARQFVRYAQAICDAAGISLPQEKQLKIMQDVLKEFKGIFKLYPDVLPLLKLLKERDYKLGIISNADKSIADQISGTDLKIYLDVLVTSDQVGVEKPAAPIFLTALERIKTEAAAAIYIGDQYQSDVLGALNVGMQAVLIDRYEINKDVSGCPRITSLQEITQLL